MKKTGIAVLTVLLAVTTLVVFGGCKNASGSSGPKPDVSNFAELKAALAAGFNNINTTARITTTEPVTIPADCTLTVTANNGGLIINADMTNNGTVIGNHYITLGRDVTFTNAGRLIINLEFSLSNTGCALVNNGMLEFGANASLKTFVGALKLGKIKFNAASGLIGADLGTDRYLNLRDANNIDYPVKLDTTRAVCGNATVTASANFLYIGGADTVSGSTNFLKLVTGTVYDSTFTTTTSGNETVVDAITFTAVP